MSSALETFLDYVASSYRFPLAMSFGAGAGVSYAFFTFFPELGKGHDPGLILLLTLGVPMVVVAGASMAWARSWRRRRAAAFPTPRPAAPAAASPAPAPLSPDAGVSSPSAP
jgi:hypothetical protein